MSLTLLAVAVSSFVVSAASAQTSDDERARELYEVGRAAAEEGRWADAAGYFQRAYDLSGRPELLFNVAIAHEHVGNRPAAVEGFEAFLRERPDAPNRRQVQERLHVLQQSQQNIGNDSMQILHVYEGGTGAGPWVLVGSGAATVAAGVVFLALADSARATVEDAEPATRFWEEVEGDADRAETFSVVGGVLLGVGAASAAIGLTWMLVEGSSTEAQVTASPTGVRVRGAF